MHATGPNSPAYGIETCEDERTRIRDAHAPRWQSANLWSPSNITCWIAKASFWVPPPRSLEITSQN